MQSSEWLSGDSQASVPGWGGRRPPELWLRLYRRPCTFRWAQALVAVMLVTYALGAALFVLLGPTHVLAWALLLTGLAVGVAVLVLTRSGTKEQPVQPLVATNRAGYVLAEEGVYACNSGSTILRARSPLYQLFPWSSLSLEFVSEKHDVIVLRHGGALLPLEAKGVPQATYDAIMVHLPDARPTGRTRVTGSSWGLLIAGLLAGCVLWAGASAWYDVLTAGKPGDGRCDVCGAGIAGWYDKAYVVAVDGEVVHEYCYNHFMALGTLHPRPAIAYLLDKMRAPRRSLGDVLLAVIPPIETAALVWIYVYIVVALARPPWRRAKKLQQ